MVSVPVALRAGGPPCGTEVAERGSSGTRTGV